MQTKSNEVILMLMPKPSKFDPIRGWGNGYLIIPIDHPAVTYWATEENIDLPKVIKNVWGDGLFGQYMQLPEMEQEITYTKYENWNDQDYIRIGFDTAHIYNNQEHDYSYVLRETLKLKAIVDSYMGDN